MLALLSPAKALDEERVPVVGQVQQPVFIQDTQELIQQLKNMRPEDLSDLMGISAKLGELNFGRYQAFTTPFTKQNAKQAVLMFKGDVYQGLDAASFSEEDFASAEQRLRILSGLYGLLRPLDLIQPYRLEMGTKLKTKRGKDLYDFWGDKITAEINQLVEENDVVLNLASNEYFLAIKPKKLKARLLTVSFKENRDGKYKVIGLLAKKARGMMARYIIQKKIDEIEALRYFDSEGYGYMPDLSSEDEMVFAR